MPSMLPLRLTHSGRHVRVIRLLGVGWTLSGAGVFAWFDRVHEPIADLALSRSILLNELLIIGGAWALGMLTLALIQGFSARTIAERDALIATQQIREHDLEVIFNSAPVIMVVVDSERRVRRANQATIESVGRSEEAIIGLQGGEALRCLNASRDPRGCGFSSACTQCQVRLVIAQTFETHQSIYKRPARLPLPVGTRDLLISTSLLTDLREPLALVVIDDETERLRAAAALQKSNQQLAQALADLADAQQILSHHERLAAVGLLAAGVAHDFNNIMTCIRGSAELLQTDPQTPAVLQRDLEVIIQSSDRASRIVRQLLDFSRKSPRRLGVIDLAQLLGEIRPLLESSITYPVQLSWQIDPGSCPVRADPTQIQQVLINLVLNARDAMPNGGELTISLTTRQMIEDAGEYAQRNLHDADWACLSVADSGEGIDPAIRSRIFEPFFTTKEVGLGTGLGLSQVYGIVRQHAGHITVASQHGQGTRFAIYLPMAGVEQIDDSADLPVVLTPARERQVLLIEDDPSVQTAIGAMLAQLGYHALSAASLPAALSCYAEHHDEVELVLATMAMPGLDTQALLQTLRSQSPHLRVVLMGDEPASQEDLAHTLGELDRLQKPVTLQRLSQVVR
jgi:two-component system, cell cycle sensor histidine kinase and response regulator CckA